MIPEQCLGRFLGIIGRDPNISKFNRLHVDNFQYFFINVRYILYIPLKWLVIILMSWTSTIYNPTSSIWHVWETKNLSYYQSVT